MGHHQIVTKPIIKKTKVGTPSNADLRLIANMDYAQFDSTFEF